MEQHFEEFLNRPHPDEPTDPPPSEEYFDIDTRPPNTAEVWSAIEDMKNGKAPRIDSPHAELLKACIIICTLTRVQSWNKRKFPRTSDKALYEG